MHLVLFALLLSSWIQVRSDAFVVKSPLGAEQATSVLQELETFYQIVGKKVFQGVRTPDLPLEVLVVTRQEIDQFGEEYLLNTEDVDGFYQKGIDRDFIVLSADLSGQVSTSVVYHELAHYLASRAMVRPPTWLNEGLGEYFGSASINDGRMRVGKVLDSRMQVLTSRKLLRLSELFSVNPASPHYNEKNIVSVFYAQSWAFVHFLMQGPYAETFSKYLLASKKGHVDLIEFLQVDEQVLEREFWNYVDYRIYVNGPLLIDGFVEKATANVQLINRAEIDVSLADIMLANGRIEATRNYLNAAAGYEPVQSRIEYTRGVIAWLARNEEAREHFVDALVDEELGAYAAFHLVQMLDFDIPEVISTLERAAHDGNREPMIYWALSEIYLEEIRRIQGLVKVAASRPIPPKPHRLDSADDQDLTLEPTFQLYASQSQEHIKYQLLTNNALRPQARRIVVPYYPSDLQRDAVAGDVVLDVQLSIEGDVVGLWLISSVPEILGNLATSAVRSWKFDPIPSKVRVVISFVP